MIQIVPYLPEWPGRFEEIACRLKTALDGYTSSIHHVGSTSIVGMAAKDIIDIQVTVEKFYLGMVPIFTGLGFSQLCCGDHVPAGMQLDLSATQKMLFIGCDPAVHVYVRIKGSYNQRYALLCRDFLRASLLAAKAYEQAKVRLTERFAHQPEAYYQIKDPIFDLLMAGAELWAAQTCWRLPGPDV